MLTKIKNYIDAVTSRTERERKIRRRGWDGTTYVYTLRGFERQECIFVHVPRAAGTSICQALFGHNAGGHKTVREYERIFGETFWDYFTFSFVRNPYARLVSTYEYLRKGGHPAWPSNREFGEQVIGAYDGFGSFVLQWLRPEKTEWPLPHFYPQTHFLTLGGELAVDYVGHVETIEEDFAAVCDRLGEAPELLEVNKTPGERAPLAFYYDADAVIQRVQEVYDADFEHFGYLRNVEEANVPPESR
jgi:hypothetical protein